MFYFMTFCVVSFFKFLCFTFIILHKTNHFKLYNSGSCIIFTMLYSHHHYLVPEYVHHPKGKPLAMNHSLPIPPPFPSAQLICFLFL